MSKESDYQSIFDLLQERFGGLGLGDKLPDWPIVRLILDTATDFYASMDEEEEERARESQGPHLLLPEIDVEGLQLSYRPGLMGPFPGRAIIAQTKDGKMAPVAFVTNEDEEALYVHAHRITVEEEGKVISRHEDESQCHLHCRHCDDPDLRLAELDGESYVYCGNCGAKTPTWANRKFAIIAWLLGKVEMSRVE